MENLIQPYNSTLMAELGAWNRQERAIGEVFGDQSLKDREFLKIKLREYERLSSLFGMGGFTRDERSMMTMLRYQRRKLEHAVYPRLLRRVLHKVVLFLKPPIDGKRETAIAMEAGMQAYTRVQIPVAVKETSPLQPGQKQPHAQQQRNYPGQRHQPKKRHKL